ncbi:hypothetical protein [Streptosporangium saharense]|uniref:hypothetical protein n=1 Tax=Streptosporangium saharense TaxID=1706840 RepID=UPI0034129CD5
MSIVSVVPYATTNPVRHPHISVFPWGEHVIMHMVMCDGPTGEVLSLEMAENLRDALDAAIEAARAPQAESAK